MESMMTASASSSSLIDQLIAMGGPVMIVLMVMAVIGLVAFVYLMLYAAICAPRKSGLLKRATCQWQNSQDQAAAEMLHNNMAGLQRLNPLHHLVLSIINGRLRSEPATKIQEYVSHRARLAMAPFEAPLKVIEVIAALAPLLGLLGTVLGMMDAFSSMSASEGSASASQLSGGIYQALTTTAAGLIVAIPFAAIAAWIEFRLRRLQTTTNTVLLDVLAAPEAPEGSIEAAQQAQQAANAVR